MLTRQQVPPRQSSLKGAGRALLEPLEKQKYIPLATAFGKTFWLRSRRALRQRGEKCGAGHVVVVVVQGAEV